MEKIKIGVIGTGRIGKLHTEAIAQTVTDAEIIALADVDLEAAKNLAEKYRIKQVTKDYRDILENPEVNGVLICSPTDTHAKFIIESAEAGKHIFCEKPVDLDLDNIKKALKAVEESGVKLMVGFNRRFDSNFKKLRQMVAEGKIGEPHIIKITSRDPAPPPMEYISVSGGIFLDMTIHDFDMARFIVGSEIEEVFVAAEIRVDKDISKFGDIDTAVITLRFKDGTLGVIDNSRKAVYGYDQRVEVFGSKGMIKIGNNASDNHNYYDEEGIHSSLPLNFFMERYINAYACEIREFCKAIIEGNGVPVSGKDGLISVAIGLAAKKSFQENRVVKINEVL